MSSQYHLWKQSQFNNTHTQCYNCGSIIHADAVDSNGLCSDCIAESIERIERAYQTTQAETVATNVLN